MTAAAVSAVSRRDALLGEAQDLRARQCLPQALAALSRLEALSPQFSRLHQERGHCHVLLRDAPAAIAALREAVRLNPTLPASWDMLEQLCRMTGDDIGSALAAQNLAMLRALPRQVVAASSLYADGELGHAEQVIREYLAGDGDNVGAMRLLARILIDRHAATEAEVLLELVIERAPDYHAARFDYAMVLLDQQKHLKARQQAEVLLEHEPGNREYLKQFVAACIGLGDHERVIDLYERLLADVPPSGLEVADLLLWRANALKVAGRQAEAIADYRAALAAHPGYAVAWFSLANLKTYSFDDDDISAMRSAELRTDIPEMDRVYLCFALGQALETRGDYAGSWKSYLRGNAIRHRSGSYRPGIAASCVSQAKQAFSAAFFAERAGWGAADEAPIFIVGLPRSGSTLVEQILASHPQVEGTKELTELGGYVAELGGADPACGLPTDPAALHRLTAADARRLGERYLAETRAYRREGRPLFIDKMPNNFWHVGLIQLILPRARIIDVRREPMACCFSNFKQLFGTANQEFTYALGDIGGYYRAYLSMMRHWDAVLPGRVLRVQYEDVVDDLDGSVRRMLDHCGLPFDPACLAFHQNSRSVRTPSSEQVRQPIGNAGITRWRRYEQWLGPLREALGDAASDYRI